MVRRFRRYATLLAVGGLAGCDLGSVTVPKTTRLVVVHAILSPQLRVQQVMVSESFSGAEPRPTANDIPIPEPIVNAKVSIVTPDGRELGAQSVDDNGVYSISLDAYTTSSGRVSIVPGSRYELLVVAGADTVRGHTVVPITARTASAPVLFNRDVDLVSYDFSNVALARGFWIRAESANDAYELMTSNPNVRIAGTVRNVFSDDLSHAFYPGFIQTLTAVAVDSNVYDYYRSGSDPFSGVGLINTVSGGVGLFGSINEIDRRAVDVTADPTGDPIEGQFTLRSSNASIVEMTLYVDTPSGAVVPARVTGRYVLVGGAISAGVWATRDPDGQIEMDFLNGYNARNVRATFHAVQHGDSLISTTTPRVIYVRAGK